MKLAIALCVFGASILSSTASSAAPARARDWKRDFMAASDDYFDKLYFPYQPTAGTLAGYHQYDARFEDFSRSSIDAEVAELHRFETRIDAIPDQALDQTTRADRELVLGSIRAELLTLEVIRPWEKNPDIYSDVVSNGAFSSDGAQIRAA